MARGRMVSKSISVSRKFNSIPGISGKLRRLPQLLYLLILPHVDDFGRMSGDPETVKALCAPLFTESVGDFQEALRVLHVSNLVEWYEVAGQKYLEIKDFDAHQTGLHKRTASKIPGSSGKFPELPAQEKGTKGKGREGKVASDKKRYLEFVLLTDDEHRKLGEALNGSRETYIARLNEYVGSKGRKYDSHYFTILSWWRKDNPIPVEAAPYVPKLAL